MLPAGQGGAFVEAVELCASTFAEFFFSGALLFASVGCGVEMCAHTADVFERETAGKEGDANVLTERVVDSEPPEVIDLVERRVEERVEEAVQFCILVQGEHVLVVTVVTLAAALYVDEHTFGLIDIVVSDERGAERILDGTGDASGAARIAY